MNGPLVYAAWVHLSLIDFSTLSLVQNVTLTLRAGTDDCQNAEKGIISKSATSLKPLPKSWMIIFCRIGRTLIVWKSNFTGSPVRKIVWWVARGRYKYLESKSRKKIFRPKKNFLTEKIFSIENFFLNFLRKNICWFLTNSAHSVYFQ